MHLQEWAEYCDQGSSQSSTGTFSFGAPTPSASPLSINLLRSIDTPLSPPKYLTNEEHITGIDFYDSPGVSPLKDMNIVKPFTKTSEC